jgi:hypothetical protein
MARRPRGTEAGATAPRRSSSRRRSAAPGSAPRACA